MKRKIQYISLMAGLCILSVPFLLPAGSMNARRVYSIDTIVSRAVKNYELLNASKTSIDEFLLAGKDARKWENPQMHGSGGVKLQGKGYEFDIGISQKIYYPGKQKIREDIYRYRAGLARLSFEEMKLYVRCEVSKLAYLYAVQQKKAEHSSDRLKRFKLIGAYIKGRRILAPQRIVERSIVLAKIRLLKSEMTRIRKEQLVTLERLNLYARLPEKVEPVITVDWYGDAASIDRQKTISSALKNNKAIRKRIISMDRTARELELAGRDVYPDFGLNIYYNQDKTGGDINRTVGGGISFSLPVFSKNKYAVGSSRKKLEKEKYLLRHEKLRVLSRLRALFAEMDQAGELLKRFPVKGMAEIERSMRYADMEFRKGRVELQTYIEMDTQTHELIEAILDAQLKMKGVESDIHFLVSEAQPVKGEKK